jgi:hypothetical protein
MTSTRPDHETAERTFRALLAEHGLPEPDEVAHWRDALVFGWHDTKAIVVVDLDEHPWDAEGPDLLGDVVQAG